MNERNRNERQSESRLWEIIGGGVILITIAAIVAPMIRGCGPSPRAGTCVHNMKECALAVQLYCMSCDGWLPSSALARHSKKWNRRDLLRYATMIGKLPPGKERSTWAQVVYDKMKNKDIMFCYEDPVDGKAPRAQVSYWWKAAIDRAWYGDGCAKPYRRLSDFPHPTDQILFYEHQPFHFSGEGGLVNGAQINVAFLDTHVKTVTLCNATSGDPVNCAANRDGEPMYFNFDNKRPKGKGNPPPNETSAVYVDPGRYSDALR